MELSVSLNISGNQNIINRHIQFQEKLEDLEEKIETLVKEYDSPTTKKHANIKRFIENYKYDKRLKEKEEKDRALFNALIQKLQESKEKMKYQDLLKKKQSVKKSVKLEEIMTHEAKYKDIKSRLAAEKEVERQQRYEAIKNSNDTLSTSVEYTKIKLEQFDKKKREDAEKEMFDHLVGNINKKEYLKIVNDFFQPLKKVTINREVINEETYDEKLTLKPRKNKSIKIVKFNNKKKYNWELKLDKMNDLDISKSASLPKKERKSPSPTVIKSPLAKKPDYLTEARLLKGKIQINISSIKRNDRKWERILNRDAHSDENSIIYNIESVKKEAEYLDSKARRNEQLLKNSGGVKKNPASSERTAELLVDSIKAKLAILNKINQVK